MNVLCRRPGRAKEKKNLSFVQCMRVNSIGYPVTTAYDNLDPW